MTASANRRTRPLRLAVLGALFALAAWAAAACGQGEDVRPVEDILDGSITVDSLTPESAVIRVRTATPVVCAVVYGTSSGYGQISTDPDMGGAAHTEHAAPLRGLQPGTTYRFRLQGTAADGTLYRSGEYTFETPRRAAADAARGENLLLTSRGAAISAVSSEFGDGWRAANAIDGNPDTEWSSKGDGDNAFVEVRLARPARVTAIGLWSRTMGTSAEIRQFRVRTDSGELLGPFELPAADRLYVFDVPPVATSTLRFEVVASTGGNTGAVEIAAFGELLP